MKSCRVVSISDYTNRRRYEDKEFAEKHRETARQWYKENKEQVKLRNDYKIQERLVSELWTALQEKQKKYMSLNRNIVTEAVLEDLRKRTRDGKHSVYDIMYGRKSRTICSVAIMKYIIDEVNEAEDIVLEDMVCASSVSYVTLEMTYPLYRQVLKSVEDGTERDVPEYIHFIEHLEKKNKEAEEGHEKTSSIDDKTFIAWLHEKVQAAGEKPRHTDEKIIYVVVVEGDQVCVKSLMSLM